jgi:hypothetical protein
MANLKSFKFLVLISVIVGILLLLLFANIKIAKSLAKSEQELVGLEILMLAEQKENRDLTQKVEELKKQKEEKIKRELEEKQKPKTKIIKAVVTAFNTTKAQTDNDPCQAKFGYICGREDVVACPRNIEAYTKVGILGKIYTCMDWLSEKYPNRFDISFDKNIEGAKQWGKKYLEVIIFM